MTSLSQASWTQDRPYFYRFKMCLDRSHAYVTGTYTHLKEDFSHEPWALQYFQGLENVGSPSCVMIGYGKRTQPCNVSSERCKVRLQPTRPRKWRNPVFDEENGSRLCAEGAMANLFYHMGDVENFQAITECIHIQEASHIYKLVTGCEWEDTKQAPYGCHGLHFRDPVKKVLWIVSLSKKYTTRRLSLPKFSNKYDVATNAMKLELPTILCLRSNYNVRLEGQSIVPGNHVVCLWRDQIIDYECQTTYPLSLQNLDYACGEDCELQSVQWGVSVLPFPNQIIWDNWGKQTIAKINCGARTEWNDHGLYAVNRAKSRRQKKGEGCHDISLYFE